MYHAIEKIGCGKRTRYCIRKVTGTGLLIPVYGKAYRTEDAARAAATALGIEIKKIGDLWEII